MSKAKISKDEQQKGASAGKAKAAPLKKLFLSTHYLQRAILVLGCFILLLPLVVDYRFYYPHIFFKSILFRISVQIMVVLYTVLALLSPAYRPRFNRLAWALIAYFGMIILCSLPGISLYPWYSWWGDFVHMNGAFAQLHLLLYFFVLIQALRQERDWLVLFTASIFFGVFMGMSGLLQTWGFDEILRIRDQGPRIQGATGNSNYFGTYMLLNFFLALYFLVRKDRAEIYPFIAKTWLVLLIAFDLFLLAVSGQLLATGLTLFPVIFFGVLLHGATLLWFFARRNARAGIAFLSILCLYFFYWMYQSQTRAVMVGFAGSLILLSVLYLLAGTSRKIKWSAALLILLVALLPPLLISNRESSWVQNSATLRRLTRTSMEEHRFLVWQAAAKGILDRPVLGWGLENFRSVFDRHAPAGVFEGSKGENWYDRAHNMFLDIGVTSGLLGLCAYLAFHVFGFVFLISRWFKTKDAAGSLILAALVFAYLVQGFFAFDTINTDGIVILVFAFIVFQFSKTNAPGTEPMVQTSSRLSFSAAHWLIVACVAAIMAAANFYTVQNPYKANLLLQKGLALGKENPQDSKSRYTFREEMLSAFQGAEDLRTTGRYEVREIFASYVFEMSQEAGVPVADKIRAEKKAIEFIDRSIAEEPLIVRHYIDFSLMVKKLFGALQRSDSKLATSYVERDLSQLEKAEKLAPTRWRISLEKAHILGSIGRTDDAIPAIKRAIALNPTFATPYVELAAIYISSSRYAEADIEWQKMKAFSLKPSNEEYIKIIRLYAAMKQFARVVALQKEAIQNDPENAQSWATLAVAYRELGDLKSARQAAYKAASMSPAIAKQLDGFLKSLDKNPTEKSETTLSRTAIKPK